MYLLKMSGQQIWLCLFTFRPIASKQVCGLTTSDTLCWLGGAKVTHPIRVQEVPGSMPGPAGVFKFDFCVLFLLCFYFFVKKYIICHKSLQFL